MKKHIILPVLMPALLCAASCANDDAKYEAVAPESCNGSLKFAVDLAGTGLSKTRLTESSIGDNTIEFRGDEIITMIANEDSRNRFTISNSAEYKNVFVSEYIRESVLNTYTSFVAMYPSGTYNDDSKTFCMTIPKEQTPSEECKFDPKANLLIAGTSKDDMSLYLKNVCSFIRIPAYQVSTGGVITVSVTTGAIAGNITVKPDGTCTGGSEQSIKVNIPKDNLKNFSCYIAVMPGTVEGLKIKYGPFLLEPAGEVTFERSKTYSVSFRKTESSGLSQYIKSLNSAGTVTLLDYDSKKVSDALQSGDYGVELILPADVESIPDNAFSGCKLLNGITIPSNVKSIGKEAFENCSSLGYVILEGSPEIGENAFDADFEGIIVSSAAYEKYKEEGNPYWEIMEIDTSLDPETGTSGSK